MKKEGKKWAKGKYPSTSAGSMRRLLTTGVTVPFPVSTISNKVLNDDNRYNDCPNLHGFIFNVSRHSVPSQETPLGDDDGTEK